MLSHTGLAEMKQMGTETPLPPCILHLLIDQGPVGLQIWGSYPKPNTNGLAEGGSAVPGLPVPRISTTLALSRAKELAHEASPGQGLHLFQVTRVLANPVHHEAAAVPATDKETKAQRERQGYTGNQLLN